MRFVRVYSDERNAQCVSLIETAHGAGKMIAAYGLCVLCVYTLRKKQEVKKVWVWHQ